MVLRAHRDYFRAIKFRYPGSREGKEALIPDKGNKLLGKTLSRERPKPRARSAAEDYGEDGLRVS